MTAVKQRSNAGNQQGAIKQEPSRSSETNLSTEESAPTDLPLDTLYDILSNRRRRLVLHYLVNVDGHEAVVGSLATQVAAWENDIPITAVNSTLRKRAYNTLQQSHLPKMDSSDVIEYDRSRSTITLTANPNQLELFLNVLPKTQGVWTKGILFAGFVLWFVLSSNWLAAHVLHIYTTSNAAILSGITLFLVFVGYAYVYHLFQTPTIDSLS